MSNHAHTQAIYTALDRQRAATDAHNDAMRAADAQTCTDVAWFALVGLVCAMFGFLAATWWLA